MRGKGAFSARETHSWDEGMWSLYWGWGACERTDPVLQAGEHNRGRRGWERALNNSGKRGHEQPHSFRWPTACPSCQIVFCPVLHRRGLHSTVLTELIMLNKKIKNSVPLHTFLKEALNGFSREHLHIFKYQLHKRF